MPTSSGASTCSNYRYTGPASPAYGQRRRHGQSLTEGSSSFERTGRRISVDDYPKPTLRFTPTTRNKYSSGIGSSSRNIVDHSSVSSRLHDLDINNNRNSLSTEPYGRGVSNYKSTYASSYKPLNSISVAQEKSVLDYNVHDVGSSAHKTTHSHSRYSSITPSSRSSSVDSNSLIPFMSRADQLSTTVQNRNDSCGSYDTNSDSLLAQACSGSGERGNVGLSNLGNTCFMNSVLQCLLNSKPVMKYILTEEYKNDINRTTSSMKGALAEVFSDLVKKVWSMSPPSAIAPKDLKSKIQRFAPRFGGYNQQDAQEFLRYFLEGLHEDVNRVKSKPKYRGCDEEAEELMSDEEKAVEYWARYLNFDNSAIVDVFVGQLKSTLTCQTCGYKSVTFDPFWDLSIPIPKNRYQDVDIQDCVESFMKEETLDGDEQPTCAKCKTHRKCTKSFKIQRLPKILVLHLKRFSGERFRQKLSTKVTFDVKGFTLKKFTVNPSQKAVYNLYGVCNHVGSVYSGHYTAYCKHPYEGKWYSFNDSQVSRVSEKQLVSDEAYVLFYELA